MIMKYDIIKEAAVVLTLHPEILIHIGLFSLCVVILLLLFVLVYAKMNSMLLAE